MKSRYGAAWFACAFFAVAVQGLSQVPAGAPESGSPGQRLVAEGRYSEGLEALDKELAGDAQNPSLLLSKVDALMGLHRYKDAAPVALRLAPQDPRFRLKAGECALEMGFPANAVQVWSALYKDPKWGETAYASSVRALLAQGKEAEARTLLAQGVAAVPPPALELDRLSLELAAGAQACRKAAAELAKADPRYASLDKLYASVTGDSVCQEVAPKQLPLEIAVREKSEEVHMTSLQWGTGSTATGSAGPASDTNIASGTQGYGSAQQSTAESEGGKTGTLSSVRRVVIPVSINGGKEEPMVLSSALQDVFVSAVLAKKLSLVPVARSEYEGLASGLSTPCDVVLLKEMNVGGLIFKEVPAKVIDEKATYWKETGGIVPLWMFRHYAIHYDRRHGKMTLYPPGTSPEGIMGEGTFRLKNIWLSQAPYVDVDIQGRPGCRLLLELPLQATMLNADHLADLGITANVPRYGHRQETGYFGMYSYDVAERATIQLGAAKIDLNMVRVCKPSPLLDPAAFGVLGREVMDLFDIYVDYSSNVLALKGYGKGA